MRYEQYISFTQLLCQNYTDVVIQKPLPTYPRLIREVIMCSGLIIPFQDVTKLNNFSYLRSGSTFTNLALWWSISAQHLGFVVKQV